MELMVTPDHIVYLQIVEKLVSQSFDGDANPLVNTARAVPCLKQLDCSYPCPLDVPTRPCYVMY